MFSWSWIFGIVFLVLRVTYTSAFESHHVSCEEFEQGARFDPYVAIDSMWKIFYFWSNNSEVYPIIFSLPAKQVSAVLRYYYIQFEVLNFASVPLY